MLDPRLKPRVSEEMGELSFTPTLKGGKAAFVLVYDFISIAVDDVWYEDGEALIFV